MAFIVARGGRFEIRESRLTDRGPRATTLATFRVLTDDVLAEAASRARTRFDAGEIRRRAIELGAPEGPGPTFEAARQLLGHLARGVTVSSALASAVVSALAPSANGRLDSLDDVAEWIGVSSHRRGRTAWQLLELGEALPRSRRRQAPLRFPRLTSSPG